MRISHVVTAQVMDAVLSWMDGFVFMSRCMLTLQQQMDWSWLLCAWCILYKRYRIWLYCKLWMRCSHALIDCYWWANVSLLQDKIWIDHAYYAHDAFPYSNIARYCSIALHLLIQWKLFIVLSCMNDLACTDEIRCMVILRRRIYSVSIHGSLLQRRFATINPMKVMD